MGKKNLSGMVQRFVLLWNFVDSIALRVQGVDTRNDFHKVVLVIVIENIDGSLYSDKRVQCMPDA